MKILRVINSLSIGGAERSVTGNIPLHIKNGYEIDLLLLDGEETFFFRELKSKKVKIFSLGKKKNILNPFYILKLIRKMRGYDLVHVSLFPSLYWVALAKILSKNDIKLIYTEHATHNRRRNIFVFKYIDEFIYKQYAHIIAISPETNKNLKSHLRGEHKITTVYNGVDIDKIRNDQNSIIDDLRSKYQSKKLLVQVASFREAKDQDTLIRALSLLPEYFHVLFVGEGRRMQVCKDLAEQLGVSNRISFLGLQNNIGAILRISDIVIMSSHWEGFGRSAIEGMAVGKPVIASNVVGLANIIRDAGLLFEVGNEINLVNKILSLSSDEFFYNEIVKKCLIRAEKYSIQKMIESYETIYNMFK
ncbi:glycosyltransferase [Flavobacteriaceae bacterium]|nr:glycosyltransferase [Flavobacteriaceae bacterium]